MPRPVASMAHTFCALRRWPDVDPIWRLEKVRGRVIRCYLAVAAMAALITLRNVLHNGLHNALWVSGSTAGVFGTFLLGSAVLAMVPRQRWVLFELVEVCTPVVASNISVAVIYAEPDQFTRNRSQVIYFFLGLILPEFFFTRLKWYVPAAICHVVLSCLLLLWQESKHRNDDVPYSALVLYVIFGVGHMIIVYQQGVMLTLLQGAEASLRQEKQSSQCLASMLCDGWCIVAADRETIIETDGRFDAVMGRTMVGSSFSSCSVCDTRGIEQSEHVRKLLEQVARGDTGAAAPLTLKGFALTTSVTLFIVPHKTASTSATSKETDVCFLVGFTQTLEGEHRKAAGDLELSLPRVEEHDCPFCDAGPLTTTADVVEDGRSSCPSTSPTDRVFEIDCRLDVEAQLAKISDVGLREGWLLKCAKLRVDPKQFLGAGAFGVVMGGIYEGMLPVAVKIPANLRDGTLQVNHLEEAANELRVLRYLRHPNVVHFFGAILIGDGESVEGTPSQTPRPSSSNRLALMLEYVQGAPLDSYLKDNERASQGDRFMINLGVAQALLYLHSRRPRILHGDLKPSNVLVELFQAGPRAKLVDFGLSRVLTRHSKWLGGTPLYMAPEVVKHSAPSEASDVFSFGRLMFFCAVGKHPFDGLSRKTVDHIIKFGHMSPMPWPKEGMPVEYCKSIADLCVVVDPSARPQALKIITHFEDWRSKNGWSPSTDARCMWSKDTVDFSSSAIEESILAWKSKSQTVAAPRNLAKGVVKKVQLQTVVETEEFYDGVQLPSCVVPHLPATDMETCGLSLLTLAMRWNVECRRDSCCGLHATLAVVLALAEELKQKPCSKVFLPAHIKYKQCVKCKLIAFANDDLSCDFCGTAIPGNASQAPRSNTVVHSDASSSRHIVTL